MGPVMSWPGGFSTKSGQTCQETGPNCSALSVFQRSQEPGFFFFSFLAAPHSTWDLTFPTRDWTHGFGKSQKLDFDVILPNLKILAQEFPGSPMVRTLSFHCLGPRLNPWLGN